MKTRLPLLLVAFSSAAVCAGCGDEPIAGGEDLAPASPDMTPAGRDPAVHPQAPLIQNNGGRVLANTEIQTIVWSGDPLATKRQQFGEWFVTSANFATLLEYGVGPGTAKPLVTITDPPPAIFDESAVGPLLRAKFADGSLPPPTANSLYVFYTSPLTKPTMDGTSACTGGWLGYHWQTLSGLPPPAPVHVPFAIIPFCTPGAGEFSSDTYTAAHEIAEAATDPEGTGWVNNDQPESEVADLCDDLGMTDAVLLADGSSTQYYVPRLWSAKTAAAGTSDPCLPVPGAPYVWFNAAIGSSPIVIHTDASGKGSATFSVEPFAEGSVGSIAWFLNEGPATGVRFSTEQGKGAAGSTQTVTITVNASALPGSYPLSLEAQAGTYRNVWWTSFLID